MTVSAPQTTATRYALLAACSPIELTTTLIDPTVPLSNGSGGYPVTNALRCGAAVALRANDSARAAVIDVSTFSAVCTYTVVLEDTARGIGPVTVATVNPASITAWAADLNAAGAFEALALAVADEVEDTLTIYWRSPFATGITLTRSATAVLAMALEYETATAILYGRAAARVNISDPTDSTAAQTAIEAWHNVVDLTGEPIMLGLQAGQGWSRSALPCEIYDALAWRVLEPAGHADDGGNSSGVTVTYTAAVAWVAPGVVP